MYKTHDLSAYSCRVRANSAIYSPHHVARVRLNGIRNKNIDIINGGGGGGSIKKSCCGGLICLTRESKRKPHREISGQSLLSWLRAWLPCCHVSQQSGRLGYIGSIVVVVARTISTHWPTSLLDQRRGNFSDSACVCVLMRPLVCRKYKTVVAYIYSRYVCMYT